jgi:hypothetical protein
MKISLLDQNIDIDCMLVLLLALLPILILFLLEIVWNLIENVGGVSVVLWGVKLATLAFAGFLFVMWRDLGFMTTLMELLGAEP